MPNQRGLSAIVAILLLLVILLLAGGGFILYQKKVTHDRTVPPVSKFDKVDLNEDVVVFLYQVVPDLYQRIRSLDFELTLIDDELERISALETEFPSEKRTISTQRSVWNSLRKDLLNSTQTARTSAEAFYVAYSVNPESGMTLISEDLTDLLAGIDVNLDASEVETARLKQNLNPSLIDRLKGLFS